MEIAVLALGCFWGPEIKFSKINGVIKTEVGYCGGNSSQTTYKEVCTGNTNHAEVVKIDFDEKVISYEEILKFFFEIHDPTTLNSQGPDFGKQYRIEIFYLNDNQNNIAEKEEKPEIKNSVKDHQEDRYTTIKSSMIGTFYRKSDPEKPEFVNVGDKIKPGDTICIIEAMKLFNEIESEISGTIIKVLVDDGTPVEFEQDLFLIDPS